MSDIEEAFKIKAQELLGLLAAQSLAPDVLGPVRALFDQAKSTYKEGWIEDALVLLVQAIQKAKKR